MSYEWLRGRDNKVKQRELRLREITMLKIEDDIRRGKVTIIDRRSLEDKYGYLLEEVDLKRFNNILHNMSEQN